MNHDKAAYLKAGLTGAGFDIPFSAPTFNEFTVKFPGGFDAKYSALLAKNIVAGLPLAPYYPELKGYYLLCVTETMDKADMDMLVKEVTS